jgi:hypothetical protein
MQFSAYWLSKRDNAAEEYEDAFAGDVAAGRFAVADGATESAFADSWARLLVEQFVCLPEASGVEQWAAAVPSAQQQWLAGVGGRALPWYAEMKISQGAFATFMGVALGTDRNGRSYWEATSVGDSCLFHTRGAKLLRSFPVSHSQEFGNSPSLIGSRTPPADICQRATQARGATAAGDRLWLMTDAMSQWFLQEHEAGRRPWEETEMLLPVFETVPRFAQWIEGLRNARRLRNDDVTLLVVRL